MVEKNIDKQEILMKAKAWFRDTVAASHVKNIKKLLNPKKLHINPFLVSYIANFMAGNITPESIAKALVYPRVLGTSITTSFGQNSQKLTSELLGGMGSPTSGLDIEFIDQVDGRKKYCQLKTGPNTINKDDVITIDGHFDDIKKTSRTNNLKIPTDDMVIGVLYGEEYQLSSHYKKLRDKYHYTILIGQEFWRRLTGDKDFYYELIRSLAEIAQEFDETKLLESTIQDLAKSEIIKQLASRTKL